jgi:tetratricopeptide (TPR) repeat protein
MVGLTLKRVNADLVNPRLHVIFVHGLGDDEVSAWCCEGDEDQGYYWPRWLAEDLDGAAVYSLGYPAAKASWKSGWPIAQAAVAALDRLMAEPMIRDSSNSPIIFICHSLGGLIVKKLVLVAANDRGQDNSKGQFLDRVTGVVFLATPHGGSIVATIANQFQWFLSNSTRDLQANDAALLDLSASYRNLVADNRGRIRHRVFYETLTTNLAKVVSPMSADPGLAGARVIAVDRDHRTICKPADRNDEIYKSIVAFLRYDALAPRPQTQGEIVAEILKKVSEDKSVPLVSLRAILDSMGEAAASYDAAEIEQKLVAKASEFHDLTDRLNRLSNADPVVSRLRAEASSALTSGLFERGDELLADAEARDLSGLEDIEAIAREKRLSAADSRAQRAGAALLRLNADAYRQAAVHYGQAAHIASAADASKAREYLRSQGAALVRRGDEFGDNAALREAISLLGTIPAAGDRTKDPLDWAGAQNNLGLALVALGDRESGTESLDRAAAAYRAALEEFTQEQTPLNWAAVQSNLGDALDTLGQRDNSTRLFDEAVRAYSAALRVYTRERTPQEWALTQMNLGVTLRNFGERERGTTILEAAIAACRASLEILSPEQVPLDWAKAQINLGNTLFCLGEREGGTAKLIESLDAYRAALTEMSRERVPLQWAMTQHNMGDALFKCGERESGTEKFMEAIATYRAALEELTRERARLAWANTQHSLGNTFLRLGERESDPRRLSQAVEAYDAALQERTCDRVPLDWAASLGSEGVAMMMIADLTNDDEMTETAMKKIQTALETLREGGQQQWAAFFDAELLKAKAIRERLKGK